MDQLVLPKMQQEIDDAKIFSSYLLESLIFESRRVSQTILYFDLVAELNKLRNS
jgi:hypothetical protein